MHVLAVLGAMDIKMKNTSPALKYLQYLQLLCICRMSSSEAWTPREWSHERASFIPHHSFINCITLGKLLNL